MNISSKIKELKYKRDRAKYLRRVVKNIGTIEETEEHITCYVKQEVLEKNAKDPIYNLNCDGMNTVYDKSREKVEFFKLNKPVYYIFDGIHFNSFVHISSVFSNIIFKNCTFDGGIRIPFADNITFENNKYNSWTDFKEYGNAFLWGTIKNLTIKNDEFVNSSKSKYLDDNFGINIKVDTINIDNSTIEACENGQVNIKAKETRIWNSTISAPEIYLDSDSIVFGKSLLKADGIIIENKNCDCDTEVGFYNVECPCTIYNGNEIITNYEDLNDKKIREERLTLVKVLKNIINKCNQNTLVESASVKKEN